MSLKTTPEWEPVIGLEVHTELKTETKLFCGCRNAFGDEPNTNICPVCLGLPGSLPVLNLKAVEFAMRVGLALGCDIKPSIFHRKNYFYPDMPKDYQTTQYDEPINVNGCLLLADGSRVGIVRAHMEEDTGKTTHVGGGGRIHDADYALVDYNRAGVPLVEIVSAPDIRSATQARLYVSELRAILVASGASDGRMEEGSLRVDANVSLRAAGTETFGTRCEIKNLNSLRSLSRAIEYEIVRQTEILDAGDQVVQQTRHWDEEAGRTVGLRSKEEAFDYRYFPEPDLVPVVPDFAWQHAVGAELGPMPAERRERLIALFDGEEVPSARIEQINTVVEHGLDPLVTYAAEGDVPPALALARTANEAASDLEGARTVDKDSYTALLRLENDGTLTSKQSREVLAELLRRGGDPREIARRMGFETLGTDSTAKAVAEVIEANLSEWARYLEGDDKLSGFFTGQVMKATRGKANGKAVVAELQRLRAQKGID
ncbi:MAG TPA: Asp-tRNA(Asn)/Glu-tRNA(Gln) amidotransferase subunit GatB [Acidimicrobiales bacterium]|nr:Asp-tRNA(Asn)/Glu-tRNA(Gln) amidotransferase subunit GatB [Acidimicrobiales bacterium]